ncbi:MAG: pilus assembly protein [Chloroflexi bacterium]|nr:pilus assembly protein [Chloroflexota bacterium]
MTRGRVATRFSGGPGRRHSGQALVELAVVTPILVLLLMAIFQFAFVLETQMGLTNAVREAARRVAATEHDTVPNWNELETWGQSQLCGDATPPCAGGLLVENVQAFDGNRLWMDPPDLTFCRYTVPTASGPVDEYRVSVALTYRHPVFFGPLAFATDAVDGSPNGAWDLAVSAEMRLEKIDDSDPLTFPDPGACS